MPPLRWNLRPKSDDSLISYGWGSCGWGQQNAMLQQLFVCALILLYLPVEENLKVGAAVALYLILYMNHFVRPSKLHVGNASPRLAAILSACEPSYSRVYWPTVFAPFVFTQFAVFVVHEVISQKWLLLRRCLMLGTGYQSEMLPLADGTRIRIDWYDDARTRAGGGGGGRRRRRRGECSGRPVAVLNHGAFVGAGAAIRGLARALRAAGVACVVVHRRGYGGGRLVDGSGNCSRVSMFGFDGDLDDVCEAVGKRYGPGTVVAILGHSCGGGFATRFVGNNAHRSAWVEEGKRRTKKRGFDEDGYVHVQDLDYNLDDLDEEDEEEDDEEEDEEEKNRSSLPRILCLVSFDMAFDVAPWIMHSHGHVDERDPRKVDGDGRPSQLALIRQPVRLAILLLMKWTYVLRHWRELGLSPRTRALRGRLADPRTSLCATYSLLRRLAGFPGGATEYQAAMAPKLEKVAVPSLVMHSVDDVVSVWARAVEDEILPAAKRNPNVAFLEYARGTHGCRFGFFGFFGLFGSGGAAGATDAVVVDFVRAAWNAFEKEAQQQGPRAAKESKERGSGGSSRVIRNSGSCRARSSDSDSDSDSDSSRVSITHSVRTPGSSSRGRSQREDMGAYDDEVNEEEDWEDGEDEFEEEEDGLNDDLDDDLDDDDDDDDDLLEHERFRRERMAANQTTMTGLGVNKNEKAGRSNLKRRRADEEGTPRRSARTG
jgi:predicted alpha/beta-fold hydrolase